MIEKTALIALLTLIQVASGSIIHLASGDYMSYMVDTSDYNSDGRYLKSSGGRGGGRSSGRSSIGGRSSGSGGYFGYGYRSYSSYYAYSYYGNGSSRTECWPEDKECLADAEKRIKETWIFTGIMIAVGVCVIACCCNWSCYKR